MILPTYRDRAHRRSRRSPPSWPTVAAAGPDAPRSNVLAVELWALLGLLLASLRMPDICHEHSNASALETGLELSKHDMPRNCSGTIRRAVLSSGKRFVTNNFFGGHHFNSRKDLFASSPCTPVEPTTLRWHRTRRDASRLRLAHAAGQLMALARKAQQL